MINQPSGFGKNNEIILYSTERENICVVCGNTNDLLKYHVIPKLYKKYFEKETKNKNSHDILLLCFRCHEKAITETDKLKD